ncbi:MAG: DUF1456 family protein [Proteobacteria bacterium]|nr:DUF1456 family protein [Pseudomonadota bacterium]
MNNNDILRSIRYTLDLGDSKMIGIFKLADYHITREQVCDWLKKDDDPTMKNCTDTELALFLNGLINDRRGKKEGPQAEAEKRINNNIVLRKLKIAFDLTGEGMLKIIGLAGLHMSTHELSALFRRPDHKHYRPCKDQILRNFLKGLRIHLRPQGTDLPEQGEGPHANRNYLRLPSI